MPASIPLLKPKEATKAFQKLGWEIARHKGSHIILVKRVGISLEEFLKALD